MNALHIEEQRGKLKVKRRRPGRKSGERTRYDMIGTVDYRDEAIPDELAAKLSAEEAKYLEDYILAWQGSRVANKLLVCLSGLPGAFSEIRRALWFYWDKSTPHDQKKWTTALLNGVCAIEEFLQGKGVDRVQLSKRSDSPVLDLIDKSRREIIGLEEALAAEKKAADEFRSSAMHEEFKVKLLSEALAGEREKHQKTQELLTEARNLLVDKTRELEELRASGGDNV